MGTRSRATSDQAVKHVPEAVMRKFCLPEQNHSALFGTLSFQTKHFFPQYDYSPLIAEIISRRHPSVLLCSGFSVVDKKALSTIAKASRNTSSVTIVETHPASRDAQSYRICAGKVVVMEKQFFSTREDRTEETVGDLERAVLRRQFHFDKPSGLHNHRAFLLVCGELGVVSGRNNPDYHRFVQDAPKLMEALNHATIILNPTHSRMGNAGTLNAKREFLSKGKRIYLSSSNWNWDADNGTKQRPSRTLHSLWYNGDEIDWDDECRADEYFCYREWNFPR